MAAAAAAAKNPELRLAILDDYQAIASPKFARLANRVAITSYDSTLSPFDSTQKKALIERLHPYEIICTMRERTPFPEELVSSLPNLKLLLTTGPFNRAIDLDACAKHNVVVAGTTSLGKPATMTEEEFQRVMLEQSPTVVSQHTWALILGVANNIASDDAAVKDGGWQGTFVNALAGKTLGILGLGHLGTEVAKIGKLAFNMNVVARSTNLTQEAADKQAVQVGLPAGAFKVASNADELFRSADVLSVHYALSERSRGIVGAQELRAMKSDAIFVNTSRGPLVDEDALLNTLKEGRIRSAALDVFNLEPLPIDSEWRTTKWGKDGRSHVLLSPHMGYVEKGLISRWYEEQVDNVEKWLDGKEVLTKLA